MQKLLSERVYDVDKGAVVDTPIPPNRDSRHVARQPQPRADEISDTPIQFDSKKKVIAESRLGDYYANSQDAMSSSIDTETLSSRLGMQQSLGIESITGLRKLTDEENSRTIQSVHDPV